MNNAYARKSRRNGFLSTATPRRYEKDSDPSVATHVNVPSNRDRGSRDLTGAGAVSFNGIATTFNTRSKSRSSPGPTVGFVTIGTRKSNVKFQVRQSDQQQPQEPRQNSRRGDPARRKKKMPSLSLYPLTSICVLEYIKRVDSVFEVIAEPNRRAILGLLVSSRQSVGEIERQLHMPQPTVSKHLRVLRDAGFVESTVDAQRRLYRLKPEPFQEVDAWLAPFRRFWSAHVDALERHLDRMDRSTPTKRKTRRTKEKPNENQSD
jgi:DNA-binding transcriptional ArsR family regulator